MQVVQINIHDLEQLDEQERFEPIQRRRQHDDEGRVARRRPLNRHEAVEKGRKPRDARQFVRG